MPATMQGGNKPMKKTILMAVLALTLVLAAGCSSEEPMPTPTPAPAATPAPAITPAATPTPEVVTPAPPSQPATGGGAGSNAAAGSMIEGFEEGKAVKEADLPEKVANAIKQAYENVKIKTVSFATYMDDQVYHVVLDAPAGEDKVEQFYVKADGTIVPYTATPSASGNAASK